MSQRNKYSYSELFGRFSVARNTGMRYIKYACPDPLWMALSYSEAVFIGLLITVVKFERIPASELKPSDWSRIYKTIKGKDMSDLDKYLVEIKLRSCRVKIIKSDAMYYDRDEPTAVAKFRLSEVLDMI